MNWIKRKIIHWWKSHWKMYHEEMKTREKMK